MEVNKDIISNYLKSEYEKSNKTFIRKLSIMFNDIRNEQINNNNLKILDDLNEYDKKIINNSNKIDGYLTNGIYEECIKYLIRILEKSYGVFFYKNYFNFCENLEKDLKSFSELEFSKYFGKKEMQIIKD